jgi:hypothetical protein
VWTAGHAEETGATVTVQIEMVVAHTKAFETRCRAGEKGAKLFLKELFLKPSARISGQ